MTPPLIRFGSRVVWLLSAAIPAVVVGTDGSAAEPSPAARSHLQPVSELVQMPISSEGLGIRLSRASAVLRQQLALARGAGLVVDEVVVGTPADRAGFRQHDVLVRLDDQLLVLPQQFDALLEAAEPSDPLMCTVLRGGREVSIPLAGRPAGTGIAAAAAAAPPPSPVRRPLRPTASSLALVQPPTPAASAPPGPTRRLSDETLLRQDADFEILLSRGDQTRLLVRDPAGRVVFDGPIDAVADRGRVPMAVRSRVADMERLFEPRPAMAGDPAARPVAEIGRLEIAPLELR